jgi:hypothetical protein
MMMMNKLTTGIANNFPRNLMQFDYRTTTKFSAMRGVFTSNKEVFFFLSK